MILNKSTFKWLYLQAAFYGGIIITSLQEEKISHVILVEALINEEIQQEIQNNNRGRSKKFHVIPQQWLRDCIKKRFLISEFTYNCKNYLILCNQ